jgi:hypothetical protein
MRYVKPFRAPKITEQSTPNIACYQLCGIIYSNNYEAIMDTVAHPVYTCTQTGQLRFLFACLTV